jgi:hypothetical protein
MVMSLVICRQLYARRGHAAVLTLIRSSSLVIIFGFSTD